MTGFGVSNIRNADIEMDVSLRAVNGRYLDLRLHMPKEYLPLEQEIKKRVTKYISRGTVDLYMQKRSKGSDRGNIFVNKNMAKSWVSALKDISKASKVPYDVSLIELAQMDGVTSLVENTNVTIKEKNLVLQQVEKASLACDKERLREGRALKAELTKQLKDLTDLVVKMKKMRTKANLELKKRYSEKMKKWQAKSEDPQRWAQELSIYIDKADIDEELSRLHEHLKNLKELVTKNKGRGKKLDFYSQELLREVNTIGSKSQVSSLTELVVDAKSVIERFREQVQNIE